MKVGVEIPDERWLSSTTGTELRLLMWDYVGIVRTTRRAGARPAAHYHAPAGAG
ncbi:hypothetical protein LNP74_20215 [Klebsiella pneumoniae subsp. pneumoniae]|nr:hypothetical protein [Klebsiella pneumoniae subsp. pneumoniae]